MPAHMNIGLHGHQSNQSMQSIRNDLMKYVTKGLSSTNSEFGEDNTQGACVPRKHQGSGLPREIERGRPICGSPKSA